MSLRYDAHALQPYFTHWNKLTKSNKLAEEKSQIAIQHFQSKLLVKSFRIIKLHHFKYHAYKFALSHYRHCLKLRCFAYWGKYWRECRLEKYLENVADKQFKIKMLKIGMGCFKINLENGKRLREIAEVLNQNRQLR